MKKTLFVLGCISVLSACETLNTMQENLKTNEERGLEEDAKLSKEKNIIKTLEAFDKHYSYDYGNYKPNGSEAVILSENQQMLCCKFFSDESYRICQRNYGYYKDCVSLKKICNIKSEDECKVYFRNNKFNSKISYFNYKKYLPDGVVNTDTEFMKLYNVYDRNEYKEKLDNCKHNDNLTTSEKQNCQKEVENKFIAYVTSGGIIKQVDKERKATELASKQKKEQQILNEAKKKEQLVDCKQAIEKAKNRRIEMGTDEFHVFGGGHTVNREGKITYRMAQDLKVVDFASSGIMVSNDCSGVWANGWVFGEIGALAAANCSENRLFFYTSDTDYATNEKFRDKGLLYKKTGNYKYTTITGATNSVPAYKATNYKTSEIDYRTYLKDKTIEICR